MTKTLSFYSIWEDRYMSGTMTSLLLEYGFTEEKSPDYADFLVFNGGADIATEIYNEEPVFRGIPLKQTTRDKEEIKLYDQFVGHKFMLGICRGAQLLNCLNGGKLWQHVSDHGRDHNMYDLTTGETIRVTSTHHQMMRPHSRLGKVLAVANVCRQQEAMGELQVNQRALNVQNGSDVEVVWYPNTRSLCIQGHPEYVPGSRFADWSVELLNKKYEERLTCAA